MPNKVRIKAALIQLSSSDDWRRNFDETKQRMFDALENDSNLLVLPENFLCFGQKALAGFAPHVDACMAEIERFSVEHSVWVICGSVPVAQEQSSDQRYYSRCYAMGPSGMAHAYDKIHLFDVDVADQVGSYRESDTYRPGSEKLALVDLGACKLGMTICYDLRFPELYQRYARSGASIFTVPSAFTYQTGKQHWEILLRARAIETQSFVLAANQCGDHGNGRRTWGNSMIIAPDGRVLANAGENPGICYAELDLSTLDEIRAAMPIQKHKVLV